MIDAVNVVMANVSLRFMVAQDKPTSATADSFSANRTYP